VVTVGWITREVGGGGPARLKPNELSEPKQPNEPNELNELNELNEPNEPNELSEPVALQSLRRKLRTAHHELCSEELPC